MVALPANPENPGSVRVREEYFPYGKSSDRRDERNRYRYIGVERDGFVGLLFTGPRWLDPSTGRFLQCDPVGQERTQLSPFLYSLGRPLAFMDSSGYSEKPAKLLEEYTTEGLANSTAQQTELEAYTEERRAMIAEKDMALLKAQENPQEYATNSGNFWAIPSEKEETEAFLANKRALQTYGRLGGAGTHSLALAAGAEPTMAADFAEVGAAGGDVVLGRGLLSTNSLGVSNELGKMIAEESGAQMGAQPVAPAPNVIVSTSPVPISSTAKIRNQRKAAGYDQVEFTWKVDNVKYSARWHTRTPGAPEGQGDTWVITAKVDGTSTGQPSRIYYRSGDAWVTAATWHGAIQARKAGTATAEQIAILNNGHYPVDGYQ